MVEQEVAAGSGRKVEGAAGNSLLGGGAGIQLDSAVSSRLLLSPLEVAGEGYKLTRKGAHFRRSWTREKAVEIACLEQRRRSR